MKKTLFTLATLSLSTLAMAQIGGSFATDWEAQCGVDYAADNVRNMGVDFTNGIIATVHRGAGADAIKLFNLSDGTAYSTANLNMGSIPSGTYNILAGDFSDDGGFFAANLTYQSGQVLRVYYWADTSATPVEVYNSGSDWLGYRMGDSLDVVGSVSDNSVKVMVSGNNAASQPLVLTTADNGANFSAASLTNAVQAQDITQNPDGSFWATYVGGNVVKYNADGTVEGTNVPQSGQGSCAQLADESIIFTVGIRASAFTYAMTPADTFDTSELLDIGGGDFDPPANGSTSVEIEENGDGTVTVVSLSERNGVAKYTYTLPSNVNDWALY